MPTYAMINTINGRREAVYSVVADSEDEARTKIAADLGTRANRQAILKRWIEEGRPVREVKRRTHGQDRSS